MIRRRTLLQLTLGLGIAVSVGCRSPVASTAETITTTENNIELLDWRDAPDISNYQQAQPNQYLAVPNHLAAGVRSPSTTSSNSLMSLPQTDEAHQLLGLLGVVMGVLTGWLLWTRHRSRE